MLKHPDDGVRNWDFWEGRKDGVIMSRISAFIKDTRELPPPSVMCRKQGEDNCL